MFNRFMNKIADAGKASPIRSVSINGDELSASNKNETPTAMEGFVCPSCFKGFPSAEILQDHYETSHGVQTEDELGDDKCVVEVHICSACKMKLASARELQSHFSRHHTSGQLPEKQDIDSLLSASSFRQELDELHTSLKEERWYSEELKKEVDRLQSSVDFGLADGDQRPEAEMFYQNQIRVLEESKALALSEVVLLKEHLNDNRDELSRARKEREKLELKAAAMAGELAELKSELDETSSKKNSIENKLQDAQREIIELQAEIQQRLGAEDALLLRQEIVKVQRMMDQLTLEKEVEKNELEKTCEKLQEEKLQLEIQLSKAPELSEVQLLKDRVSQLRQSESEWMSEKEILESEMTKCKQSVGGELSQEKEKAMEAEIRIADLERSLEENRISYNILKEESFRQLSETKSLAQKELQEKLQELAAVRSDLEQKDTNFAKFKKNFDSLKKKEEAQDSKLKENLDFLQKTRKELDEKTTALEYFKKQISESNERNISSSLEVTKLTDQVERLEAERKELYEKIESGDGAKTAIQQLQQENALLQEQLIKHQEAAQGVAEKHRAQLEEMNQSIQKQDEKSKSLETEISQLHSSLTENQDLLSLQRNELGNLENNLALKIKQSSMLEASNAALKMDMENQLSGKQLELDKLKHQCEQQNAASNEVKEKLKAESQLKLKLEKQLKTAQSESVKMKELIQKTKLEEEGLRNREQTLQKTLEATSLQLENKEKDLKEQNERIKEIQNVAKNLEDENKILKANEKSEREFKNKLQLEVDRTKEALLGKEKEKEELNSTLALLGDKNENLNKEIIKRNEECNQLKISLKELTDKAKEASCQIINKEAKEKKILKELDSCKESLTLSKTKENEMAVKISEAKVNLKQQEDKVLQLEEQISSLSSQKDKLEGQVQSSNESLNEIQLSLRKAESQNEVLERKLVDAENWLTEEKQKVSNEEKAKTVLATELQGIKAELQKEKTEKLKVENQMNSLVKEKEKNDKKIEDQISLLTQKVKTEQSAHKQTQLAWEEKNGKLESQIYTLNENLNTYQEDLNIEKQKASLLQSKADELGGLKLELEAKLDNALDERRALLDRCLGSEDECEKLRSSTTDLRHKLDDTLAALHELGRENQSLQIENTKLMHRKWAEDGEVTHCTTCKKQFTVTIRKHHCRSCGSIFCNECSTRTATIASYKKAVRVCDSCFEEVSQ